MVKIKRRTKQQRKKEAKSKLDQTYVVYKTNRDRWKNLSRPKKKKKTQNRTYAWHQFVGTLISLPLPLLEPSVCPWHTKKQYQLFNTYILHHYSRNQMYYQWASVIYRLLMSAHAKKKTIIVPFAKTNLIVLELLRKKEEK